MDRSTALLVALTSRDLSDDLPVLQSRDLWAIVQSSADQGTTPAALFEQEGAWETALAPELRDLVGARLNLWERVAHYVDQLRRCGIWVSSPFEDSWPERMRHRLGPSSPLILYVAGNPGLLGVDGIGVVGS